MNKNLIPQEIIQSKIIVLRGKKVMLDRDLAMLYGVETKVFNQAVKRNIQRFPKDFMFQITNQEFRGLMSQIVTSNRGGTRKMPYAFTEHGILMLSSVLNSDRAIQVNIQIMRTFTKMREMLSGYEELKDNIADLEKKYDKQFKIVFDALHQLLMPPDEPKKKIGF